jgi:hypothetical protein
MRVGMWMRIRLQLHARNEEASERASQRALPPRHAQINPSPIESKLFEFKGTGVTFGEFRVQLRAVGGAEAEASCTASTVSTHVI